MKNFILGLETGLYGGSISLSDGVSVIAEWVGADGRVKTDNLLEEIETVLKTRGIGYEDLTKIVVSSGPGSYTGLRIGYAVALGLKVGLETNIESRFLLDDLLQTGTVRPITTVCLSFARDEVIWKIEGESVGNDFVENIISSDEDRDIFMTSASVFLKKMSEVKPDVIRIPELLFNDLTENAEETFATSLETFDIIENNFASVLIRASLREGSKELSGRSNDSLFPNGIFYPKKN